MIQQVFWSPIIISLQVTLIASFLSFIIALFVAWMMKGKTFKGKSLIETVFLLPLVLPPSVVGFGLLFSLGRNSWVGQLIEWLFQQPLVFTKAAAVIAAIVVSFPLIYLTLKTGFENIDQEYDDVAKAFGAGKWKTLWSVTLPLASRSLMTGYVLGFARGIGEFGATLMFAGNIPGQTQTIPTAIYLAVESGNMTFVYYWVLLIILFSFVLLMIAYQNKPATFTSNK